MSQQEILTNLKNSPKREKALLGKSRQILDFALPGDLKGCTCGESDLRNLICSIRKIFDRNLALPFECMLNLHTLPIDAQAIERIVDILHSGNWENPSKAVAVINACKGNICLKTVNKAISDIFGTNIVPAVRGAEYQRTLAPDILQKLEAPRRTQNIEKAARERVFKSYVHKGSGKEVKVLTFEFLGNRDYLSSNDIIDVLLNCSHQHSKKIAKAETAHAASRFEYLLKRTKHTFKQAVIASIKHAEKTKKYKTKRKKNKTISSNGKIPKSEKFNSQRAGDNKKQKETESTLNTKQLKKLLKVRSALQSLSTYPGNGIIVNPSFNSHALMQALKAYDYAIVKYPNANLIDLIFSSRSAGSGEGFRHAAFSDARLRRKIKKALEDRIMKNYRNTLPTI